MRKNESESEVERKMYDKIFARTFSQYEQKKLGCGALVASLLIAFTFWTVYKPLLDDPLQVLNLRLSMEIGQKLMMIKDTSSSQPIIDTETKKMGHAMCNLTEPRSDYCEADGDIRIQGGRNFSKIHIASSSENNNSYSWEIRPYARKGDTTAMGGVRKWSITNHQVDDHILKCTINHTVPAILFSVGGYAGNHFHDFTDVVIPLFATSRQFNGQVQFLITDKHSGSGWTEKFSIVLQKLSNYEVIDIDKEEGIIHCFPRLIVGSHKSHKELNIEKSESQYSMGDFRMFLRSSYSLNRTTAIKIKRKEKKRRPRLLIISRKNTRAFMNKAKIVKMARKLGYDVVVAEADGRTSLSKFANVVNSCDVVMGVHGAGLTNIVFLPDDAIFIQIVPLGGMEWLAKYDFEEPSKEMKLRYLEYKIEEKESSLIQQYPIDHAVLKDPYSIGKQGWSAFKSVYLDKQNVMLNVTRFRPTLLKALELLHD